MLRSGSAPAHPARRRFVWPTSLATALVAVVLVTGAGRADAGPLDELPAAAEIVGTFPNPYDGAERDEIVFCREDCLDIADDGTVGFSGVTMIEAERESATSRRFEVPLPAGDHRIGVTYHVGIDGVFSGEAAGYLKRSTNGEFEIVRDFASATIFTVAEDEPDDDELVDRDLGTLAVVGTAAYKPFWDVQRVTNRYDNGAFVAATSEVQRILGTQGKRLRVVLQFQVRGTWRTAARATSLSDGRYVLDPRAPLFNRAEARRWRKQVDLRTTCIPRAKGSRTPARVFVAGDAGHAPTPTLVTTVIQTGRAITCR
ncbi:hypothetical protein [Nocardioides sp. R-C-SC26]|uniref:hypothetical protein n=1 Tax=Nocardioides sp. R-C-SC26 TaxID=2870414 RepID=UPI001E53E8AB|nr:hypothetical protein [Nocardioides sp. R-C-SC26]